LGQYRELGASPPEPKRPGAQSGAGVFRYIY